MKQNKEKNERLGRVGGQAVLEGVMMKGSNISALAVRREDGSIAIEASEFVSVRKKYKILSLPIIRGVVSMIETLVLSMKTLTRSAELVGGEDLTAETKFEKWLQKTFGDNLLKVFTAIGTVLGLALALLLFSYFPVWITTAIDSAAGGIGWFKNLIAGAIKIAIFVLYVWGVSFMPDIKRTYEYHGAEHKSIACYEAGLELTPENAKKCTRFHPRCGTSFMFLMLILSIIIFSVVSWDMNRLLIIGLRLLLLPIVIGVGFEIIMIAGKHQNVITRIITFPGILMQRITTCEPDEQQLEVAIAALKAALPEEFPIAEQTTEAPLDKGDTSCDAL